MAMYISKKTDLDKVLALVFDSDDASRFRQLPKLPAHKISLRFFQISFQGHLRKSEFDLQCYLLPVCVVRSGAAPLFSEDHTRAREQSNYSASRAQLPTFYMQNEA